jgi:hypothetical protein
MNQTLAIEVEELLRAAARGDVTALAIEAEIRQALSDHRAHRGRDDEPSQLYRYEPDPTIR